MDEAALRQQAGATALALYRGALLAGFDDDANEAWTGWLRYERLTAPPAKLYGAGSGSNYQKQGLQLAKQFKRLG